MTVFIYFFHEISLRGDDAHKNLLHREGTETWGSPIWDILELRSCSRAALKTRVKGILPWYAVCSSLGWQSTYQWCNGHKDKPGGSLIYNGDGFSWVPEVSYLSLVTIPVFIKNHFVRSPSVSHLKSQSLCGAALTSAGERWHCFSCH